MTPVREAIVLPAMLLTVAFLGGLEPGAPTPWAPPSLFSLILAVMVMVALVRSGTLAPERLLHGARSPLANANGFVVIGSLFAAIAQLLHMLTPRSGLPSIIVAAVLFLLLLNTLVMSPDRPRLLRSVAVVTGSAFLCKFVILAGLADPQGGRLKRVLLALFDVATLGTVTQPPIDPAAGYIAFLMTLLFLVALTLLPSASFPSAALQRSEDRAITWRER